MTHRMKKLIAALAACLALAGAAGARQSQLSLSGRVVMEAPARRREALPQFTARLYFPKESKRPTLITYTDGGGNFKFDDIEAGRYLLEIYQENDMVFQKVLVLDGNLEQPFVVALRPRS
jgi:hypothetical protein